MKKTLFYSLLLLLCATNWRCANDESPGIEPDIASVTFSVASFIDASGRTAASPMPSSLYISLTNDKGEPIFSFKQVKIMAMGNSYVTEPLELKPGHYRITDFALSNDGSSFVYAVPKKGSILEKAVINPLPYRFRVLKNQINNFAMQVVDVTHSSPSDFGYTTFSIDAVNPLRISVFTRDADQLNLAAARAYLLMGSDTLEEFSLAATINTISFSGEPLANYKLIVARDGYNPYELDFTYQALADTLNGLALKVYLSKPLTILAYTGGFQHSFLFSLYTIHEGTFHISWGDGTTDTYTTYDNFFDGEHTYATDGNFPIVVTGDLDEVNGFYAFYDNAWYDAVDFSGLPNLEDVSTGWMQHGPTVIDLRYNPKIRTANLAYNVNLQEVLIPEDNHVVGLTISGPNQLTSAVLDDVIYKLYNAVVRDGGYKGTINITATYIPSNAMLGPPSADALEKLHILKTTYNWNVFPWDWEIE